MRACVKQMVGEESRLSCAKLEEENFERQALAGQQISGPCVFAAVTGVALSSTFGTDMFR